MNITLSPRRMLYLGLLIISHSIVAQPTDLITKDTKNNLEEYEVLSSDKEVKHGSYLLMTKRLFGNAFSLIGSYKNGQKDGYWEKYYDYWGNNIEYSGYFKKDLKDSVWIFYHHGESKELKQISSPDGLRFEIVGASPVKESYGLYKDGNRIGPWVFLDVTGKEMQVYDYDKKELLYNVDSSRVSETQLLGEVSHFYYLLHEEINYSKHIVSASKKYPERFIEIEFQIDPDGEPINITPISDDVGNQRFTERLIKSISLVKGRWYPKKIHGKYEVVTKLLRFKITSGYSSRLITTSQGVFNFNASGTNLYVELIK